MKKLLIVQIIILAAVLALGAALKFDVIDQARLVHRSLAMLAGLITIVTTVGAWRTTQAQPVKVMSVLALLLTFAAAAGGKMAATGSWDYNMSYGLMVASGVVALVLSVVMLVKLQRTA